MGQTARTLGRLYAFAFSIFASSSFTSRVRAEVIPRGLPLGPSALKQNFIRASSIRSLENREDDPGRLDGTFWLNSKEDDICTETVFFYGCFAGSQADKFPCIGRIYTVQRLDLYRAETSDIRKLFHEKS